MDVNLFFVRHGQTTANRDGILQGHCDYPLTDLGVSELEATGIKLKDVKFSHCFVSDLSRARDSAKYIMNNLNEKPDHIIETKDLREQGFGVREAQPKNLSSRQIRESMAETKYGDRERWADIEDNAETHDQVKVRQEQTLALIAQHIGAHHATCDTAPAAINVLVVSHGGYIGQFLRNYCSTDASAVFSFVKILNGAVSIVHCQWEKSVAMDMSTSVDDNANSHNADTCSGRLVGLRAELSMTNMVEPEDIKTALGALH